MSDSADICIRSGGRELFLYTHSCGSDLPHLVRTGLLTAVQSKRTTDVPYLIRIVFCHMLTPEELYEHLGFGIDFGPAGDKLVTIDVDNQTIEAPDYGIPRQAIKDFIYQTGDDDEDREEADLED